eukprot:419837-Pyramimonas_sp.AAC.1
MLNTSTGKSHGASQPHCESLARRVALHRPLAVGDRGLLEPRRERGLDLRHAGLVPASGHDDARVDVTIESSATSRRTKYGCRSRALRLMEEVT